MIRFRQHIPTFVDREEPALSVKVATVAELLAIPWIAGWTERLVSEGRRGTLTGIVDGVKKTVDIIYTPTRDVFHRFSLSTRAGLPKLMAEFNGGDMFWVLGFVDADDPSELASLPEWEETEHARLRREAWNRGEDLPEPAPYRCAEHGVDWAECCLPKLVRS